MHELTSIERISNILNRKPVPTNTKYDSYRYFVDEGLRLGKY